jgi:ATP/maltotriose-dependent transcriptional regulator MalT
MNLPSEQIKQYHQTTEGWITGLQLISYSTQTNLVADTRTSHLKADPLDRHISDYLFEEVFTSLPLPLREFLLASALPRRFCAGLCNAMTNTLNSSQYLDQLEQTNLFIFPLDNYRVWYRFHDLFRQFLLQQLLENNQQQTREWGKNGIDWFQASGHYEDAIALSTRIKDWDTTESLVESLSQLSSPDDFSEDALRLILLMPDEVTQYLPTIHHIITRHNTSSQTPSATPPSSFAALNQLQEPLTNRESQVLSLLSQGLSNKDIADRLFISLNTLKVHIRNLYGKMGVENRTQALIELNKIHR